MSIIERDILKLKPEFVPYVTQILNLIKYHNLPMRIFETLRTAERQQELFKLGNSKCDGVNIKSNHQSGYAVDFVYYTENTGWSWDTKHYHYYKFLAGIVKEYFNVKINIGAYWVDFVDMPHYELSKSLQEAKP